MSDLHLRLVVDVKYDVHEASELYLKANLREMVKHASGEGAFTGDSSAEVDEWSQQIIVNPDEADRLFTHGEVKELYRKDTWGTHPKFTRELWRHAVMGADTLLGYWHWVEHRLLEDEANAKARAATEGL